MYLLQVDSNLLVQATSILKRVMSMQAKTLQVSPHKALYQWFMRGVFVREHSAKASRGEDTGRQLVFANVHVDSFVALVSVANLNNRELSAALGVRGIARGLLKVPGCTFCILRDVCPTHKLAHVLLVY